MQRESFFKHAAVYGLANLLLQGAGFILLPIYLRCLEQDDYGVLEVVGRLAETVGAFLLFGGFRQAMLTFYQQADDEPQRRRLVSSALTLYLVFALVGGGLALGVLPDLCTRLAPTLTHLTGSAAAAPVLGMGIFRLAILGILLEPFSFVPLTLLQARVESATYLIVVVSQLLLRITLSIILMRYMNRGVEGALLATVVTGLMFGVTLTTRELARGIARPSFAHMKALFRFALPLMPGGLLFFVMNHGDRFFLVYYRPAEELGIYALGYKIAMTVSIFSLSPLYMVWSARMFSVARLPEAPIVFGQMFTRILSVYVFAGLGVCLFGHEAIEILGGAHWGRASVIIAPVLLGCIFQGAVSLMDAGLYVRHRPGMKLIITLVGTVGMVILYAVLIPRFGSIGAALATLFGFAFLAALTWLVTQSVFPVRYEYARFTLLLGLAVALWLLAQTLPEKIWSLYAKAGIWLLGPLLLWLLGWITSEEKEYLRGLVEYVRGLVRRLPRERPIYKVTRRRSIDMDLSLTPARTQD